MSEALLTQEVGSLAKPNWRVKIVAGQELNDIDRQDAYYWADRLDIAKEDVKNVLDAPHIRLSGMHGEVAKALAQRYAVKLQEQAGLDVIYDGEQQRSEMYQHAIDLANGFSWRGRVRAFDNKSYRKAAVVDTPGLKTAHPLISEFDTVHRCSEKPLKVPLTGAYTLGAWSFDEHYNNRRDFVLDLARNVIRPEVEALIEDGAEWIQIDEPAATTVPGEVPLFVESFNESVKGLLGKFSVHICFSDYSLLFPHVQDLENCSQFSLEFANRDGRELGRDAAHRPAYEVLQDLKDHCPDAGVGLGVTSVHEDEIEWPELVRDRVLRAVDILGDPAKVYPSPDCGLRTRSWDVAYNKLRTTVEGTHLAREQLGV